MNRAINQRDDSLQGSTVIDKLLLRELAGDSLLAGDELDQKKATVESHPSKASRGQKLHIRTPSSLTKSNLMKSHADDNSIQRSCAHINLRSEPSFRRLDTHLNKKNALSNKAYGKPVLLSAQAGAQPLGQGSLKSRRNQTQQARRYQAPRASRLGKDYQIGNIIEEFAEDVKGTAAVCSAGKLSTNNSKNQNNTKSSMRAKGDSQFKKAFSSQQASHHGSPTPAQAPFKSQKAWRNGAKNMTHDHSHHIQEQR